MHVHEIEECKTMSEKCPESHETPAQAEQPKNVDGKTVEDVAAKDGRHSSSKDRHSSSKDSYYLKKHIIAAINRSLRSSNKSVQHTFDDEKNDSPKSRPSVAIIVKQIDLDKESILYTREKCVPDVINLDTFRIKEVSSRNSDSTKHNNNNNNGHHSSSQPTSATTITTTTTTTTSSTSSDRKRSSDDRTHHRSEKRHSDGKKRSADDTHRSSDKKHQHHISDETLKGPYLLCHSCGRKDEKKWVHADCKNKCCRSTTFYCDSCLRHKIVKNDYSNELVRGVNFGKYMYVIRCPIGRGCSLHMDYERIMHLRSAEQREVATEFLKQAFKEDDKGFAHFTIAIVHNGARYMPDMLKLMVKSYPTLKVNTTKLKSSTETELTDLLSYYKKMKETYNNGTFAHDPLNETQAACVKNADEYGAYLPEMLSLLERSPFLSQVLPWGDLTTKRFQSPHESDDGPIFWCRPGEQIVSLDRNSQRSRWNSAEIEAFLKERKKNMHVSEKKLIVEELKKYRRSNSAREFLFEDRTRPHADQAWGNSFEATAAVGVIQAIHPDEHPDYNRICKEIVVFQAKHLEILEALLHIDTTAAPKQQCAEWLDDAKLNMIRQMKIEFSKLHLRDNDIYFIPRKIVHQFKTVSATLSIAWHTRLREYYPEVNGESAPTTTPLVAEEMPNCVETTPKKKNRSRSVSLESREREGSRSAKKRKHDSRRSRSSSKKKFKERTTPRKNGHAGRANTVSTSSTVASAEANCNNNNAGEVETVCEQKKGEAGDDAIKADDAPSSVAVKIEPSTADEDAETPSNGPLKLLTPQVRIVDIGARVHKEDEVKCENGLTRSLSDSVDAKCEDETKSMDGASQAATEICTINAAAETSPSRQE